MRGEFKPNRRNKILWEIFIMSASTLLLVGGIAFAQHITVSTGDQIVLPDNRHRFIMDGDRVLIIKGKVAGDFKNWLVVEAHNAAEWKDNGFDPSYTRIVSDYKPIFRKMPNGTWEVMFTSEIAEGIP